MRKGTLHTLVIGAFAAALLLAVSMPGCSSDNDGTPAGLIEVWLLQAFALDDGKVIQVDDPEDYSIRFMADGKVAVRADCNVCSGDYTADGNMLRIGPLGCTRAACPPDSLDTAFLSALGTTERYEIVDGRLVMDYNGGNMFLTPAPALFQ
jgi:heat shock protein HslJ